MMCNRKDRLKYSACYKMPAWLRVRFLIVRFVFIKWVKYSDVNDEIQS